MPEYRNIPNTAPCYSSVATCGDRTLCITVDEMVACGVSESYIKKALNLHRNEEWSTFPHHKEGKTVYLHFFGLKANYRATIKAVLMEGLEPDAWYNKHGRASAIKQRLSAYLTMTAECERFFDVATYENGEKLSPKALAVAKEACCWLTMFSLLKRKSDVKEAGYNTVSEFYDDAVFLMAHNKVNLPASYTKLRAKIREFEQNGPVSCIDSRGRSNKNAAKVYSEEQTALLRTICGRSASYNAQQVADFYNLVAEAQGWERISRRSAHNYMQEYNLIIEAGRNGSEAFRNKISMQRRRLRPTEALSFWSLDGWTVELYYQKTFKGPDGKTVHTYTNRLTAVVVVDACCDFPVGVAIGEGENVKLIASAVKNAIDYVHDTLGDQYRPYQIQSDHYGIKSMSTIYSDVAEYFTPARVKNAKSKPVERYFRTLNTDYCQKYFGNSNWSGFGITSKKSSQPNIDVLNANKRKFPDKEGVIEQINWIISQERAKKMDKWVEAWDRMPQDQRLILSRENYLLHFGMRNDRTIRMNAGCLEPTILGLERAYDSFDINFRRNPLQSWTVHYDERDLSNILVTDNTGRERYLLNEVYKQPMALRDRKSGDHEANMMIDEYNKRVLEPYVVDVVAKDEEIVNNLIQQTPAIEGWRTATMLTDSRGQQKAYLQHSATIKSEEDLIAEMGEKLSLNVAKSVIKQQKKEEKRIKKTKEQKYEEYAKSIIDFDKFE